LREKNQNPDLEIFYWKDEQHREADFLLKEGEAVKSIYQTCWDLTDPKTKDSEVKSLLKAMKELKLREGFVFNKDFEGETEDQGMKIVYLPLWKFLLN